MGALILPSAIFTPLQFSTHSEVWFVISGIPQAVLTACAFAMVGPVLQAVFPYRLRGMGTALTTMYIFFIGGFAGGILADFFTNAFGIRDTVILLGIPTSIIGSLLLMNGARFIRHDLSLVVEELLEEQEEQHKRAEQGAQTPVLQVANIDFSYGTVQVLFDVNFEIQQGETLALLGTNGAGKSTILRVISGLEVPERGVVRLNGQNITYVAPEARARMGIIQLPGGKGVFPSLTVAQNLAVSARLNGGTHTEIAERVQQMLDLFPELESPRSNRRAACRAASNRCWPWHACCSTTPTSCSSTNSRSASRPSWSNACSRSSTSSKNEGQTMLIVEQSLNVALSIADRAIFLDKG